MPIETLTASLASPFALSVERRVIEGPSASRRVGDHGLMPRSQLTRVRDQTSNPRGRGRAVLQAGCASIYDANENSVTEIIPRPRMA